MYKEIVYIFSLIVLHNWRQLTVVITFTPGNTNNSANNGNTHKLKSNVNLKIALNPVYKTFLMELVVHALIFILRLSFCSCKHSTKRPHHSRCHSTEWDGYSLSQNEEYNARQATIGIGLRYLVFCNLAKKKNYVNGDGDSDEQSKLLFRMPIGLL